jgi:hypothetical protein
VDAWLGTLARDSKQGLDTLFTGSPGYPGSASDERLQEWLRRHVVRPAAFHIGATGRSLAQIRQEEELHRAIGAFLDAEEAAGGLKDATAQSVRAKIQDHVRAQPDLAWAKKAAPPRETRGERLANRARAVAVGLAAVPLLPILVPVVFVGWRVLVFKEARDPVQIGPPEPSHVRSLEATEDLGSFGEGECRRSLSQNHLASVIPVKPGMLRAFLLPTVLFVLNLVARIQYTKGKLGGIPSIHFAHWSLIDKGRHLVFLSNFDGSWESYLADFIDKANVGLTAVWSNTVNFPRTRNLLQDGASDGPRFRQWARCAQCDTAAWYTAYPDLTIQVVDRNSALRDDLFTRLDEEGTVAWLRRL